MSLKEHLPKDKSWIDEVAAQMGWPKLLKYYNRIFLLLQGMHRESDFSILENVHPDNYDLFLKCTCAALSELAHYGQYDWTIEQNATVIHRL